MITTGNILAARRTTVIPNLVTYGHLANASLPNHGSCPTTTDRAVWPLPKRRHHPPRHRPHHHSRGYEHQDLAPGLAPQLAPAATILQQADTLLNLLRGNPPREEPVARMITCDCHRSETDVADSRGDIHLLHHLRATLLRARDSQTGQGLMSKSVYIISEALTQAW